MNIFSKFMKIFCERINSFNHCGPETTLEEQLKGKIHTQMENNPCPNLHEGLETLSQMVTPAPAVSKRVRYLAKHARKRRVREKNQRRLARLQNG